MSILLQSGIVSASVQVILDRFAAFAQQEIGLLLVVDDELKKLERTLLKVQALVDNLRSQQQQQWSCSAHNMASKLWLRDLHNLLQDTDDFLDEIGLELIKLSSNSANDEFTNRDQVLSSLNFNLPSKVTKMQNKLEDMAREMDGMFMNDVVKLKQPNFIMCKLQTSSLVDESCVVGRGAEKDEIMNMLLSEGTTDTEKVSVIAIEGMAGVGKTTLAQVVYNDKNVVDKFDFRIWVSVSVEDTIERITKSILACATGKTLKLSNLDPIQIRLQRLLEGKRVPIVLDDMWNENASHWDVLRLPFKVAARGSKILVTTRSMIVSRIVATAPAYHVKTLSNEDCWELIKQRAQLSIVWLEHKGLREIGRKIAEKCKGLPLAATVLGSVLHFKSDKREWDTILKSKLWELPEVGNEILPALKLSYDHLPPPLKRCFAYCSMFPPNFEFIKDDLVQLWVSEGFILPEPARRIEDIGKEYFDILVLRSFFQFSQFDSSNNNQPVYKMHHLIHDLAQFVSDEDCFRMEDNMSLPWPNFRNARHSCFVCNGIQPGTLQLFHKCKRLRTLIFLTESGSLVDQVPYDLFLYLHCMRVLNLSCTNIVELPDSVGTLKHLRYLCVSDTPIEKLPESITKLYGLETLKLKNCFKLLQLPKSMRNLVNLRHLEFDIKRQLSFMPLEFGKLTSLQTLSAFIVGKEKRQGIEELKDMMYLQGSICITNLENVANVKEAVTANLDKKLYLDKLELQWNDFENHASQQVLAGLRPHNNIQELIITGYGGFLFPSWLSDPSFYRLESIHLQDCKDCKYPPPLGQLPALRSLYIQRMHNLVTYPDTGHSSFPSLHSLTFHDMLMLKEWKGLGPGAMPKLCHITIVDCPKLNFLPQLHHLTSLENLELTRCPLLQCMPDEGLPNSLKSLIIIESNVLRERCRAREGEDWSKIRSIPNVQIDYEQILGP